MSVSKYESYFTSLYFILLYFPLRIIFNLLSKLVASIKIRLSDPPVSPRWKNQVIQRPAHDFPCSVDVPLEVRNPLLRWIVVIFFWLSTFTNMVFYMENYDCGSLT